MKFTGPVPLALITHISKLLKAMRLPSGDLDRHMAIEGGLIGLVDCGHPTSPNFRDDLIWAKRPMRPCMIALLNSFSALYKVNALETTRLCLHLEVRR